MCYQISLMNVRNEHCVSISWPHNHVQIHGYISISVWSPRWKRLPYNQRPLLNLPQRPLLSAQHTFAFVHQKFQVCHFFVLKNASEYSDHLSLERKANQQNRAIDLPSMGKWITRVRKKQQAIYRCQCYTNRRKKTIRFI